MIKAGNARRTVVLRGVLGAGFTSSSLAVFAAFSTPPSATRKNLINNTIILLQQSGIWDLCDLIYFLAAADSQAASINWKTPASNILTLNNSPTFNADRGFTGDAISMSLTATYTNVLYTQNNAHISAFGLNTSAVITSDLSVTNVTPATRGQIRLRNLTGGGAAAGGGTMSTPAVGITLPGLIAGNRTDSSNITVFTNGASDGINAQVSATSTITAVTFLANGFGGFSDRQVSFGSAGAALSTAQHLALFNTTRAYLTAVGAP